MAALRRPEPWRSAPQPQQRAPQDGPGDDADPHDADHSGWWRRAEAQQAERGQQAQQAPPKVSPVSRAARCWLAGWFNRPFSLLPALACTAGLW